MLEQELSFHSRVAIVTGAGGGLGRSHALELARRGASVVVNDLGGAVDGTGTSPTAAQQVVREIVAAGGDAVPNYDTVATPEGGEAIVQAALDTWGRVDVVVNNAGILRDKAFHNMGPDQLDPVVDVHLKGAFHVTRPAWKVMREQGYGRVVNTSSGSGIFGNFGQSNYGAAKMGLVGLTRVLAIEGVKYDIKVNAIAPMAKSRMSDSGVTVERSGPEWVSPLVAYLTHQDCPVTGEVYSVGFGRVARVFIGVTPGYVAGDHLTAEGVRDHFDQIRSEDGYLVPVNVYEEVMRALPDLAAADLAAVRRG
ncbi:MAG: SDR family oxidoreductase [Acidimicrobiia bacterium]